jgi:hypothetical protein
MGKMYAIYIELYMKGPFKAALKGNNSCNTHNFKIKVRNVKMVYVKLITSPYLLQLSLWPVQNVSLQLKVLDL